MIDRVSGTWRLHRYHILATCILAYARTVFPCQQIGSCPENKNIDAGLSSVAFRFQVASVSHRRCSNCRSQRSRCRSPPGAAAAIPRIAEPGDRVASRPGVASDLGSDSARRSGQRFPDFDGSPGCVVPAGGQLDRPEPGAGAQSRRGGQRRRACCRPVPAFAPDQPQRRGPSGQRRQSTVPVSARATSPNTSPRSSPSIVPNGAPRRLPASQVESAAQDAIRLT